ncbi:unnamed protein product [Rotaria magnacalcarata]|uniref:Protein Wnt n=1 Tax=Rotaria magnacalcarata TaxID=392030 RepID=A0A816NZY5_9BILA|nr:unnamed protein product [Rotaria magnacalcarata]CAF2184693.1 unnamed protein product [Rotaria magnacalcarata]CAF3807139.1 unnamed protein product [Rotaria magnacalcarata]CAF3856357.1 unnamed protein product [Rotaria magnacalcarata]
MSSLIVLLSFIIITTAKSLPSDFMLLGLTPTTQLIHGLTCQSYRPFIGENTDYLCSKIPQLHIILHEANIQTRQQCQYHFRDHPWGCQLSSKVVSLRRFLRQASKEASFYTTLASATLTMNLINACIKGQVNDTNCLCLHSRQLCQTDPTVGFQLAYLITDGTNMSKIFQGKFLFKINQANKEVGRQIVKNMMKKECHCHGVSGSCELQICRLRPAQLTDISSEIYTNIYKKARYIEPIDYMNFENNNQLFYARKSINYCRPNAFIDYQSAQKGRECSSKEVCEQVCCNKGYEMQTELKLIENCQCYFSWNIANVECKPCQKKITRMICL